MADEFKHTDASEMDAFMAKTQASQLLEIWLNGRETNGHVAEAFRQLDVHGKEIQRLWVTMSNHIEKETKNEDGIEYIKKWGRRGTGAILFVLALLGGAEATVLIIHYAKGWM